MLSRNTRRAALCLAAAAAAALMSSAATATAGDDKDFKELFNGKDFSGFHYAIQETKEVTVKDKKTDKDVTKKVNFTVTGEDFGKQKTFKVEDGVIVVSGKPNGYFFTEKSYKNYVLRFDWKFIKDGNSGLLVHITGKQNVWPKCVEVQGQQSDHARIFAIGGAKFEGKTTTADKEKKAAGTKEVKDAQKKAIKKGEWNTTEVVCREGMITTKINGVPIDGGAGDLKEGQIGWQSEGTELHFKNLKIRVLE
jgi:hypothetical protein